MTHLEVMRIYLSIPVVERKQLRKIIHQETEEEKDKMMMYYINVMKDMTGIDVRSKDRSRDVVDARAVVAYVLNENGFREYPIGRIINKDHSMVHTYIDEIKFYLKHGINYKRIELLKEYKHRLEIYEANRQTI